MQYKLRPYQEDCVQKGIEVLTSKKPCMSIIVAPTAAGKSIIISELAKRLNDFVVVLQPNKELLEQNYAKYISYGLEASIYSASLKRKELDHQVIFATIGSIVKDAKSLREKGLKYILVDEAHRASKKGSQLDTFIKQTGVTNILGLTATPVVLSNSLQGSVLKMMNRDYTNLFKSISHVVSIKEMVDNKFWTPLEYRKVKLDLSKLRLNTSGAEFTKESVLKNYIDNNLEKVIINEVEKLEKESVKSILVFCPSVQEAKDLSTRIKNSKVVWGDMNSEERSKTLTQFNNQEFNVLINCEMLQIGYDNPNLEAIIMATPTNSVALYYQILGRALRIKEGKEKAIVLDLVGNTDRFGRVEDFSFENQDYSGGWAMFSDQKVLTNFPLGGKIFPTRESLKNSMKEVYEGKGVKITFGKYKGSAVEDVLKKDKGYLIWLINNQDFNWGNNIGVKNEIYKLLNLELPIENEK
jgi:DNA repair protein RadD